MEAARGSLAERRQLVRDVVVFRGHPMVRADHPTTIEVTTEKELTTRGDCIIGVDADKGCRQLGEELKAAIRTKDARVRIRVLVGDMQYIVNALGDPGLELSNPHEMVIRKSSFMSDRTLALHADAAARDVPRPMVRMLMDPSTTARLEIEVG